VCDRRAATESSRVLTHDDDDDNDGDDINDNDDDDDDDDTDVSLSPPRSVSVFPVISSCLRAAASPRSTLCTAVVNKSTP
jgi:hypothetical protein